MPRNDPQDPLLGAFEEQVLLAVVHCGDEAYGMTIRRELSRRSGREVAIGAVYATLERLQEKGYVATRRADPSAARRGRARKYFDLLPSGVEALTRTRDVHRRMWRGVDLRLLPGGGASR